ncbi:MAG TPA: glycosyltransferase family 39 protein [Pyrinomonadaceae bacterium]|nr:glycosyltransferase family 39 protein [Pyrinomonadaceae bacterium]
MTKINEKKILFLLLSLHLVITLPLAFFLNVWADEASTLATTEYGFLQTFQTVHNEKQAPLYFLLVGLWRELNGSIFFARLFSIICSLLAIKVFFDLARKFFNEKAAIFVTAAFALHPFLIWASLEIRVYSLVVLLSVLLLKFFYEGYREENPAKAQRTQRKAQVYFVLTSIFSLYANYYLGFLLVGCFAAHLVLKRWKEARSYFLQMLVVGVAILPLIWIIKSQFAVRAATFQAEKSLLEGVRILWHHFLTFVLPTEIYPTDTASYFSIFRLWFARLAVLAIIFLLIKNKGKIADEKIFVFGTISSVIGLFFLIAYLLLGSEFIAIRHAAVLFAPVILLVAGVLIEIRPRKNNLEFIYAGILAALLAIFFSYSIFALYPNLAKRGDWRRVAAFIEQNEKANQPIVVFQAYDVLPFRFHYQGINKILPDERILEWSLEDEFGSPNSFSKQIEFVISEIPPEAREIWLATDESCQKTEGCRDLENFVQTNYTIEQTQDFYVERIRLLRKR